MHLRLILAAALAVGLSSHAQAQQSWPGVTLYDSKGAPIGTTANPLTVTGGTGTGGSGAAGSVTPAGTNGTSAQAIQGITNGVPVPVTGTFASTALTGAQEQDVRSTQTLNAATLNAAVTVPVNGQGTLGFALNGLTASGATLTFEQSEDGGTTWTIVNEVNAGTGVATSTRTTDGQTRIAASGRTNIRFRVSSVGTGTITVAYTLSVREGMVALSTPLPPGANTIGSIGNTAFGISGTLPAYATTPTFNLGTLNGAATAANQAAMLANQNVTTAGTSATSAQAVQGTVGGVPQATTIRATGTNRSATVGTTAITLMPANTLRQGWKIKNDSTGDLWINFDATATAAAGGGNIKIPASGYLSSEPGYIETGAMSAIGSAAGLAITAREH